MENKSICPLDSVSIFGLKLFFWAMIFSDIKCFWGYVLKTRLRNILVSVVLVLDLHDYFFWHDLWHEDEQEIL